MKQTKNHLRIFDCSKFTFRCALFPLTVIKTQLQVQSSRHNDAYNGMIDAFAKIYRKDGFPGLYRGFFINSFQIVSGVVYISTYESTRHFLTERGYNKNVKAIVSGATASLAGQTIIVPFDIISQHIMVLGMDSNGKNVNPLNIQVNKQNKSRLAILVAKEIMRKDGFLGFYRGYGASLLAYVPNSALWWGFYHLYQGESQKFSIILKCNTSNLCLISFSDELLKILPQNTSHLLIQTIAGSLGGFTTTLISEFDFLTFGS